MINIKKIYSFIVINIFFTLNSFAVTIVKNTPTKTPTNEPTGLAVTILTIFIMSIIALVGIIVFMVILYKIYKILSDYSRERNDFLYTMFSRDSIQLKTNTDKSLKKKAKRWLYFFYDRRPIYCNTKNGLKFIGLYNGEAIKKESYYILGVYNKLSMFKIIDQIIIIPNRIKDIVSKQIIDNKPVLIIECEGIDQILNTDYYFIPLLENPKDKFKYVDFADEIHKNYFEKTVYRDIIKENLQSNRDMVIKSVESNPSVQFKRRT